MFLKSILSCIFVFLMNLPVAAHPLKIEVFNEGIEDTGRWNVMHLSVVAQVREGPAEKVIIVSHWIPSKDKGALFEIPDPFQDSRENINSFTYTFQLLNEDRSSSSLSPVTFQTKKMQDVRITLKNTSTGGQTFSYGCHSEGNTIRKAQKRMTHGATHYFKAPISSS